MLLFENFVIPEMTIPAKKKTGDSIWSFFLVTFLFGALQTCQPGSLSGDAPMTTRA